MPMSKGTNLEKPSKINNSDKQCIFNNFIYKENCLTIASNDTTVDNSDVRRRSISPTEDLSSQNLEGCKNPTITIAMVDSGANSQYETSEDTHKKDEMRNHKMGWFNFTKRINNRNNQGDILTMGLEDLVRNNYKIDFTNQKCFLPYASTSVNAIVCIKDVSTIQYFNPTYVTPSVTATSVAQNQQIQAWGKKSQNKYMFFTEFLNISDKLPPPHITDTSDGTPKKIGAQELKEMILDQVRDKKVAKQILASKQEDERERQEQIQVLRQTPLPLAEQSQSGMQLGGLISLRKCNQKHDRNRTTKPQTTKFVASLIQEAETTIEVEEIKERYAKKEEIEQPNDQIITLSK
ncbi:hypothetical protein GLOIN_2v1785469 [Rhizophagus irregularis DAOM 181602=DAOM 197198]|nr:hypothetical protein GLOIN_2v1785469 [Rhizophagus irregularis DAOM 181602=DAOM 197198]